MTAYKIEAGTAQHIGSRHLQTDRAALYTAARSPGYVMAVLADGLGSATAAEQVLHTSKQLLDEYRSGENANLPRLKDLLRTVAQEAHDIIVMHAATGGEPQATMLVLILTPQGQAVWAHVGDSRLYRFTGDQCSGRTNDQEYVQHLVNHDGLPLDAAKKHRSMRMLMNVLGNRQKAPFVTVGEQTGLKAGDSFLLASDGLWQYFTDAELGAVISRATPRQASEKLINKAIERAKGKGDNCTMAIIKLVTPPTEAPSYTVQRMGKAV
jgi:PPM family protein phosphatase